MLYALCPFLIHFFIDGILTRKDGCYSEKLNSCIAGKAMMLTKTHLVEERICVQASRCYHKVTGPHVTCRKRERILSRFSSTSIHVFKDDIVQPMEIEEQLSFARMEVEESR